MNLSLLFRETITAPRVAAARLIAMQLDLPSSLALFFVAIVSSVAVLFLIAGFQPIAVFPGMPALSPFSVAAIVGIGNLVLVGGLMVVARMFDGQGGYAAGVVLFGWLQIVQIAVQAVQLIALIISTLLAGILSLAGFVFVFWVLFSFISEWQGLNSLFKAMIVFVLAVLALSLVLSVLMLIAGVSPPNGAAL